MNEREKQRWYELEHRKVVDEIVGVGLIWIGRGFLWLA